MHVGILIRIHISLSEVFDGDVEKICPLFYDSVSGDDIVFKNLNRKFSVILGFEVANSILAHLNDTITPEFTDKEQNIIKYISRYAMKTM